MTTRSTFSFLLVSGYTREIMQAFCHIPNDVLRNIFHFFFEIFPNFVIKSNFYRVHDRHGIALIDMSRKVSYHLNIFDISANCLINYQKNKWDHTNPGLAVALDFQMPSVLHKLLPANVRESRKYNLKSTAIFKIGGYVDAFDSNVAQSSVIIMDDSSIYSKHQKMNSNSEVIINGYQFLLPFPTTSEYYHLAFHSFDSTLYAICNTVSYSESVSLFSMSFKPFEETEEEDSKKLGLRWRNIVHKEMGSNHIIRYASLLSISNTSAGNDHLMFVHNFKTYLFPLRSKNEQWIDINDSNFNKMDCGMCYDSINNCVYAGCGRMHSHQSENQMDLYDFHKNQWYDEIIPAIDNYRAKRLRPKFWMQDQLLFIGGGGSNNILDVIFLDLRENNKKWKLNENQWSEYFSMKKYERQFNIERIV